eukprot:11005555-Heterocapsa_arctica.AAC.1
MTQAAKLHGSALLELRGDREFMLMAAKLGPSLLRAVAIQYASLELKCHREFILQAVKHRGSAL